MRTLRDRYDEFIYRLFYSSFERRLRRSRGLAYLAYLIAKAYTEEFPPSESVKVATDDFLNAMMEHNQ